MEDRAITFLNNVFNIQITSLSIILPLVFLFIQMSAKEQGTGRIIRSLFDFRLIVYFLISVGIILVSGFLGLLVGLPDDRVWQPLRQYKTFGLDPALQGCLIVLFVLNLLLVAGFVTKSVRHIDPKNYIFDALRREKRPAIETFIFRNQGLPYVNFPRIDLEQLFLDAGDVQRQLRVNDAAYLEEKKEYERQERRNKAYQDRIRTNYRDIFATTVNILNYNLTNTYIDDFNTALSAFVKGLGRLEGRLDISVDSRIKEKLLSEFMLRLRPLYSAAQQNSYPGFSTTILETTVNLARQFLESKRFVEVSIVIDTFEGLVDETVFEKRTVLIRIFRFFVENSTELFRDNTEKESINNFLRAYSRISEKVIDRFELENSPIMMRSQGETLFGWVNESKYALFEKYIDFRTGDYPLILLDMNYCLFRAYTKKLKEKPSDDFSRFVDEQLYHFYDHPKKLFLACVKSDNIDGACLCVSKYRELFNWLEVSHQLHLIRYGLIELIDIGFLAVSCGKLLVADYLSEGVPQTVLELVTRYSAHAQGINSDVFELYLRSYPPDYDHKATAVFLLDLGERLQSNFGLNFTWQTKKWNEQ